MTGYLGGKTSVNEVRAIYGAPRPSLDPTAYWLRQIKEILEVSQPAMEKEYGLRITLTVTGTGKILRPVFQFEGSIDKGANRP